MSAFKTSKLLALLFCLLACLSLERRDLLAAEIATIVLESGEILEDVSFEVDQSFKVLRLEGEGKARIISFTDIESIHQNGLDVTARLLGGMRGESAEEDWLSEESEEYKEAREPLWRWGFRVGANYSVPAGSFYDGFESGIGYEADILLSVNHYIAVRASISKSGMQTGKDLILVPLDPGFRILDQDLSLTALRYSIAAQIYQHFDKLRVDPSMLYVYFGMGAISHRLSLHATIEQLSDGQIQILEVTDTTTKFLTNLGFGLTKTVSRNFGFDAALQVDGVWVGTDARGETAFAWVFDIKAGVIALF